MSNVLVNEASLSGIAQAIRQKNGTNTTYKPGQMAAAIQALPGASTLGTKSIVANGTYAASGDNLDGFSSVSVDVPNSYTQSDEGKVVSNGELVAQTARSAAITQNGTYDTTNNNEVTVNVSGGGGAAILSGASTPTAEQGSDGDIYLKCFHPIVELPSGYNAIEFLATQGAGPYINTGLLYSSTSYYELKQQYQSGAWDDTWFYGAVGSSESIVGTNNGVVYNTVGNQYGYISRDYNCHIYAADANGVYIDGQKVATPNWNNVPSSNSIGLFARGTGASSFEKSANYCRIYYCKIYDGNTLVRYFIPAIRSADSAIGMYDTVNNSFYGNIGSGSFVAGIDAGTVKAAYAKVSGAWQALIGTDIDDVGGVS